MKKFNKFLSSALALMLCAGTFVLPVNAASADGEEPATTPLATDTSATFKMDNKISVRVGTPTGIRFRVQIGSALHDTVKNADDFGFLIFPHDYLAKAKANVDASNGEVTYHDKITDEDGDDFISETEYAATNYGLYDYVEVKASDGLDEWDWATQLYEQEVDTNGDNVKDTINYYVNGVLNNIDVTSLEGEDGETTEKEDNKTVDFAAIAWYKVGEVYTYADFDVDYSASLQYGAQQAYVNAKDSEDLTKETYRTSMIGNFTWLKSSRFEVRSGEDMKEISDAVAAGATFEELTRGFRLSNSILVPEDYTPVPSDFAGAFDYNGKKVFIASEGVTNAFATPIENNNDKVVGDIDSLLQASAETADAFSGNAGSGSYVEDVSLGGETVNALKFAFSGTRSYVYAKLDYSADELELIKECVLPYVVFNVYVEANNSATVKDSAFVGAFDLEGTVNYIETNKWLQLYMTVDQLMAIQDTAAITNERDKSTALFGRIDASVAADVNIYLTSVEFVEELPEEELPEEEIPEAAHILFSATDASKYRTNGSATATAVVASEDAVMQAEGAPTNAIKIYGLVAKEKTYITVNYTKEELQAMLDEGTYDTVTFKFYYTNTHATNKTSTGAECLISLGYGTTSPSVKNDEGKWTELTFSLSTLFTSEASMTGNEIYLSYFRQGTGTLYISEITLSKAA